MHLILLRHAKSAWDDPSLDDHDRPLAPRGLRAVQALRDTLARDGFSVDAVVSSTAVRARETARRTLFELGPRPVLREDLYLASPRTILKCAAEFAEPGARIVLVGHNPGMHALAVRLVGDTPGREADRIREKYPTGALAEFEVPDPEGDIAALDVSGARLVRFLRPKDLPDADDRGL